MFLAFCVFNFGTFHLRPFSNCIANDDQLTQVEVKLLMSVLGNQSEPEDHHPYFISGVKNLTVPRGNNVTLTCRVRRLGRHKVSWIHYNSNISTILSVHDNLITSNPRIRVGHVGKSLWNLHIRLISSFTIWEYLKQIITVMLEGLMRVNTCAR